MFWQAMYLSSSVFAGTPSWHYMALLIDASVKKSRYGEKIVKINALLLAQGLFPKTADIPQTSPQNHASC